MSEEQKNAINILMPDEEFVDIGSQEVLQYNTILKNILGGGIIGDTL